jgi:glycosyltransferase involved in cell wall biosynthesis
MKILLSNKFYYPRGGDCIYTLNLEQLLKQYGHEVAVFSMQFPENIASEYSKYFPSEAVFSFSNKKGIIESLIRPFGTRDVKQKFKALLNDFKPDVVHLNNVHTYLSPVMASIAHRKGIKVVWTLHDYKLLCPRYDSMRDGLPCELCYSDKKNVLKYSCMKNSKIASLLGYFEALYWNKATLEKISDVFICPSEFLKVKMLQGGFTKKKLQTLCNFIDTEKTKSETYNKEEYYCYIGRLSLEKGVKTLINAAKQLPFKLKIIGNGPLVEELQLQSVGANIEFIGYKEWPEIKQLVGQARFAVIPSEWYENNPLSILESLSLGTPVLGTNIGGIPELIEEGRTGLLFESSNTIDLKEKIEKMFNTQFDYPTIAQKAHDRFSAEEYYKKLMEVYGS